ncbi:MAG TPA: DUF4386 domain-containing protein [Bryobacteraceae bacterium]|nr:DUF4386 domain-containing protein [Bryobacteraceae bacterium]
MTRTENAKIAGTTFLVYIVAGIASMVVFGRATTGIGIEEKLAGIAQHPTAVGVVIVLGFVQCFAALVLGITLYAITREQDNDLAMLGLACRVGEGVIAGSSMTRIPALAWLATASGVSAPDAAATHVLGAYLLRGDVAVTAIFFAVGSTLFSYLFVRGRMIPMPLAWTGLVASVLLVIGLPLQAVGFLSGPITTIMWLPMLAFEVPLALWLIIKGVSTPLRAANS